MTTNDNKNDDSISMQKIIVMLIFVFLVIIIIAIILAHYNNAFADYDFVRCYNEDLKINITYPIGTYCDIDEQIEKGDIFDERQNEEEEEGEHEEESEDWNKNGWTKLK